MPIRIQRYDDGHGPSGLCPSYGFFATIGFTQRIDGLPPSTRGGRFPVARGTFESIQRFQQKAAIAWNLSRNRFRALRQGAGRARSGVQMG